MTRTGWGIPIALAAMVTLGGCQDGGVPGPAQEGGFWGDFWDANVGGAGGGAGSPDSDGDGLSDAEEQKLGSNPSKPDSDGDGWVDGDEVDQYTDPVDADDHPYTGGWDIGACRHDLDATGDGVGQVTDNFELIDQFGDTLKLHDFCHKEVLLVGAAFW